MKQGNIAMIARGFCVAMVWANSEEGTNPRCPKATIAAAEDYIAKFVAAFPHLCEEALSNEDYGWYEGVRDVCGSFGHDLFLTAAGHGVGFADRDALGETGEMLNEELRKGWQRWEVETEQYRGWMYLRHRA